MPKNSLLVTILPLFLSGSTAFSFNQNLCGNSSLETLLAGKGTPIHCECVLKNRKCGVLCPKKGGIGCCSIGK